MYTKAIVRRPGKNFSKGITTSNIGKPDFKKAVEQHKAYCEALKKCGLEIILLEADEKYPDGCFVEDTAIVTEKMAVITKPADTTRMGEENKISEILSKYKKIERIHSPGNIEGGDILRKDNHFFIGVSKRTNSKGAKEFAAILNDYGYTSSEISVKTVLHLKTGIAYIGKNNFVSVHEFEEKFNSYNLLKLNKDESYAANCLLVNDYLLMPKGFPKIKNKIFKLDYKIIEIEMSEFRKMDGGLSCLSLLF